MISYGTAAPIQVAPASRRAPYLIVAAVAGLATACVLLMVGIMKPAAAPAVSVFLSFRAGSFMQWAFCKSRVLAAWRHEIQQSANLTFRSNWLCFAGAVRGCGAIPCPGQFVR